MNRVELKRAWAEINLDGLAHNMQQIKEIVGSKTKVMGVIKADAYGHGDILVAKQLAESGVDWLGVSNLVEALGVRSSGIITPILIFGPTPIKFAELLTKNNISQIVHSLEYAKELSEAAQALNIKIKCHIKIETGMNRLGFRVSTKLEYEELLKVYSLPNLEFEGILTHFSSADQITQEAVCYTNEQFKTFMAVCDFLKDKGIEVGLRHCCNSSGTVNFKHMHLDMVRPGIILYGLPEKQWDDGRTWIPVMTLKSVITSIKSLPANQFVSYERTYKTTKPTKIGVVSISYADGLRRNLSNCAKVLCENKLVPIIGNICMDQMMIDLTDCKNANVGDEVTIFGDHSVCNVNVLAKEAGAITNEIVCELGRRVSRVYFKNGLEYKFIDYCEVFSNNVNK